MSSTSIVSLPLLLRRLQAAYVDLGTDLEVTFSSRLIALYGSLLVDTAATVRALLEELSPAGTRHASTALGSVAILKGMLGDAQSYDGVRFRQELELLIGQLQSLQQSRVRPHLLKGAGTKAVTEAEHIASEGFIQLLVEEHASILTASISIVDSRGGRTSYADHVPTELTLEPAALILLRSDGHGGEVLTRRLFADDTLLHAWEQATAWGQGRLPVRLYLPPQPAALHAVPWELLRESGGGAPIVLNERRRFARVVDAVASTGPSRAYVGAHRAVVAVTSPRNLKGYGLAEVDIYGEVGRAIDALGSITTHIVAEHPDATIRSATLAHLLMLLRDEATILYLVCHGRRERHVPHLCFEKSSGDAHWVSQSEFVDAIQRLAKLPRLIILASCGSAGDDSDNDISTAVGPALARAGVSAVIAMNGPVSMRSVALFMPIFFRELLRDSQVDRALAAARSSLQGDDDWWRPVLWLHAVDGAL